MKCDIQKEIEGSKHREKQQVDFYFWCGDILASGEVWEFRVGEVTLELSVMVT